MRVLAVCESPPTLDPTWANGSTMIPAHVLPRLPADWTVDLAWSADRPAGPAPAVVARAGAQEALPVRSSYAALAALAVTRLPRAGWQRAGGRAAVARLAAQADVVWAHGLHAFPLVDGLRTPLVVHEVDPWSHYWAQRAEHGSGPRRAYDLVQARRARRLEGRLAAQAHAYVVVNAGDAARLGAELGRTVEAVPNGVDLRSLTPRAPGTEEADLLVFVGTLDYPPNVAAVTELATQVLPRVRAHRPSARLVVAGRRPGPEVAALAGEAVEVLGAVDDVRDVYARAAVAVYPGALGRGTKNTVLEALAVGCPVVASPEAARGLAAGEHALLGDGPDELAAQVLALLADDERRRRAGAAAAALAGSLPDWDAVSATYARLLAAAAG